MFAELSFGFKEDLVGAAATEAISSYGCGGGDEERGGFSSDRALQALNGENYPLRRTRLVALPRTELN